MYNLMKKFGKGQRGLTLLELLGVIVIIAILAAVLITRINASMDKGRETGIKNDFRAFTLASETVLQDTSGVLNDGTALTTVELNENLDAALQFDAGTLVSDKEDPWKGQYSVEFSQATDPTATATTVNDALIVVTSTGKDTSATATGDDYKLYTYLYNGQVSTCTVGYSGGKNQESDIDLVGACGTAVVVTP